MNERCPPKGFRRQNTWPPVGAAVWGGLGGKGLTEKVALTLRVFGSSSLPWLLVCSLFVLAVEDVSSPLPVPVAMPDTCCYASPALKVSFLPSGIISQSKLSSPLTLLLVMVSYHSNYTHQSLRIMWETLAGQVQRSVGKNIFKKPLY